MGKADEKSKFLKIYYPKGARTFSYGFFTTTEGQEYLKVIKNKEYKISCICNGEANELPMYVAAYKNSYAIKNYRNDENNRTKHNINCPRSGERIEGKKTTEDNTEVKKMQFLINESGIKTANFNVRDFMDREVEPATQGHKGKHTYIANQYTSLFKQAEMLLSLAWENHVVKEGKIPKEGNLFYGIFKDLAPNCKISDEVNLSDIMFTPNYKKPEDNTSNDITEFMKKVCYSIYKKGKSEKTKGYYMYILAKLNSTTEIDENTIELNLSDPYKKGTFKVSVRKNYFENKHGAKKKVFNADYYISAYISTDYKTLRVEKMATIPVLKDRGCYIQSSKEVEFANMLISNGELFLKPPQANRDRDFGGYIPDFLLLDKVTKQVTTIVEVFGFYSEDYRRESEAKIKYFSAQNDYKFIYWRANDNEPIPVLNI